MVTEKPASAFFTADGDAFIPTDATVGPWGPGLLFGSAQQSLVLQLAG